MKKTKLTAILLAGACVLQAFIPVCAGAADDTLTQSVSAAEKECTKTVLNEDFETNDINVNFTTMVSDPNYYTSSKETVDGNNVMVFKSLKSGSVFQPNGMVYYTNSVSGKSITEFTLKFPSKFFEFTFIELGKIGSDYLSVAAANGGASWYLNKGKMNFLISDSSASVVEKLTGTTSVGLTAGEEIRFKIAAFETGIAIYVNNQLLTQYTGEDAAEFVSQPGVGAYGTWNGEKSVYIDNVVIKSVPSFDDRADWYYVNEDFETFDNDMISKTEDSSDLSYTAESYENNSVLKMSMGVLHELNYQVHAGFAINTAPLTNYVIETRFKADSAGLPQGIIIYSGKTDATTGQQIGLAFTNYRRFFGITRYGNELYYNSQNYSPWTCGEDAGFSQTDWHTYKLVVEGNKIDAYIDGTLYFTCEDAQMSSNGLVGIRMTSANFENHNLYIDSFSVRTTAPQETKILTLEKQDNNSTIALKAAYMTAEDFEFENGNAYIAVYEDDVLVAVVNKTIAFDKKMISDRIMLSYAKQSGKSYKIKLFTWKDDMQPIFDVQ